MSTKRRKFDKDFKASAVRMVLEDALKKAEVGRRLGVDQNLVGNWVRAHLADGVDAFRGNGNLKAGEAAFKKLEKEVYELRQENEFLKKTAGYFASLKK